MKSHEISARQPACYVSNTVLAHQLLNRKLTLSESEFVSDIKIIKKVVCCI